MGAPKPAPPPGRRAANPPPPQASPPPPPVPKPADVTGGEVAKPPPPSRLTRQQQIRATSVASAARSLAEHPDVRLRPVDEVADQILTVAAPLADWIRDTGRHHERFGDA